MYPELGSQPASQLRGRGDRITVMVLDTRLSDLADGRMGVGNLVGALHAGNIAERMWVCRSRGVLVGRELLLLRRAAVGGVSGGGPLRQQMAECFSLSQGLLTAFRPRVGIQCALTASCRIHTYVHRLHVYPRDLVPLLDTARCMGAVMA